MARFCPLFSSSSGNCIYIGSGEDAILIDAGVSCKSILEALKFNDIDISTVKAIAVTHAHSDHIKGISTLLKKFRIPLITTAETAEEIRKYIALPEYTQIIVPNNDINVGSLTVHRFPTSHDSPGSSGFCVSLPDNRRVAVCTDLGFLSDEVKTSLIGCDLVMIESNHDFNRLKNGPYPFPLKQRILSDVGHLSNASCSSFLPELVKNGTTRIILGHLSQQNNLPALALSSARASLVEAGFKENFDYILYVAPVSGGKVFSL